MRATLIHDRPFIIDANWLRAHFRAQGRPPSAVTGDPGLEPGGAAYIAAAVLIPIVLHPEQLTVLFTRRTTHLRSHSGQVSFPGGRVEEDDSGPEATALRETLEEIGLQARAIEVLGRLGDYTTRTGYRVSPVVALVGSPLQLELDPHEVEDVFEVPLSFFLDPANHERHTREFQGRQVQYTAMPYREHYIWGATAAMLVNLYRHLREGV